MIGTGLALDWRRIGDGLVPYWYSIAEGSSELAGTGLAMYWQRIGTGLALDWHWIDILIGNGLAPDWDRIGNGWMGGEIVLRRDTSAGPYSKLVPRYSTERSPIDIGLA